MFAKFEAILAEGDILAMDALIDCLVGANLPEFAAITIIIILFAANLFGDKLFLKFVLFLFDFPHDIWCFLIPAEWTLDNPIIFKFVFGPLHEAL
jgi:hypothetical protein